MMIPDDGIFRSPKRFGKTKSNKMENGAYSQDPENGTELNLVEKSEVKASGKSGKREEFANEIKDTNPISTDNQRKDVAKHTKRTNTEHFPSSAAGGQEPPTPGPSTSCKPEVCQRARERYTAPDLRGSPWHRTKTIFLLATIGSLVVWAIIYSTLSKLDIV